MLQLPVVAGFRCKVSPRSMSEVRILRSWMSGFWTQQVEASGVSPGFKGQTSVMGITFLGRKGCASFGGPRWPSGNARGGLMLEA